MGEALLIPLLATGAVATDDRPMRRRKAATQDPQGATMKILMVLTSHDMLGDTGRKTGFWLEEFAAPYYVFPDAGAKVPLAPPKGGQPPIDPKSDDPANQTPAMTRFKNDPATQAVLAKTVRLEDVLAEDFDTIFYSG